MWSGSVGRLKNLASGVMAVERKRGGGGKGSSIVAALLDLLARWRGERRGVILCAGDGEARGACLAGGRHYGVNEGRKGLGKGSMKIKLET